MKSEAEVEERIATIEKHYAHVLTGGRSAIAINAPRALMQLEAESKLEGLYWVLGRAHTNPNLNDHDTEKNARGH